MSERQHPDSRRRLALAIYAGLGALVLAAASLVGLSVASATVQSAYAVDINQQRMARIQASLARTGKAIIGHSVQGAPIHAECYGREDAPLRAVVAGSMHGSEPGGIIIIKRLAKLGAPPGVRMCLIPNLNPDGLAKGTRTNARKVDLNRNFPDAWTAASAGPQYNPGPSAASEPETRAAMAFLSAFQPDLLLSNHQALNAVDRYDALDLPLVYGFAKRMKMEVKKVNCAGGPCYGTLTGWYTKTFQREAITVEYPATSKFTKAKVNRWSRANLWAMQNA